jgi:cytochrome o ubiquinol oxidase subunit 3
MSGETMKHPGLNLGEAHGSDNDAAEELAFGFWVFMMSDAILFGVLFATYVTMAGATAGGPGAHALFDLKSAFIETLLLLASSFSFGMASLALKYRHSRSRLLAWLGVTALLGLAFLGFEIHDFVTMAHHGGVPSRSGFVSAFFALVPLHGLHVTAGLIWLFALVSQILRYGTDREVKIGILRLGLFWHFLDIVWVGIFSVVYLGGLA